MPGPDITLSVVSHGQNALVNQLLGDIQRVCADRVGLVLTENVPDPIPLDIEGLACPVERIVNKSVKGFGANHNAAFARCTTPYFCVCNPDIRLPSDPFPPLLEALAGDRVAVAGPLVRSPQGSIEDSARRFPTAGSLLKKLLSGSGKSDYPADRGPLDVDWVGGMFMLFRSDDYRALGGFDEAYFLYYEDIDLCRRLHAAGRRVAYQPAAEVVHDARRASRRNLRLAMHHLAGIVRFLWRRGWPRGGSGTAA
jgi:N-acetylglucosaminyl-diphospho-decaprenol L-rhamnosyltransferase